MNAPRKDRAGASATSLVLAVEDRGDFLSGHAMQGQVVGRAPTAGRAANRSSYLPGGTCGDCYHYQGHGGEFRLTRLPAGAEPAPA
jgi:hypothetical protein